MGAVLTQWEKFLTWEDDEEKGIRLELQDGEVVTTPPPRPVGIYLTSCVMPWLHPAAKGRGCVANSFPYRPASDFQFWRAGIAYLTNIDWEAHRTDDSIVGAPPLIIETLSPSNRTSEIERQRLAAFSGGAREFWDAGPKSRTVEAFALGKPSRAQGEGEKIAMSAFPGAEFPVGELFRD